MYPARLADIKRFGQLAKKVKPIPLPPPLSFPFAMAVNQSMAHLEKPRQAGKRLYEDWMEEDDLLGGNLQEQDLCQQLQRGPRGQGVGERGGFMGRRMEGNNNQGVEQGVHLQDRGKVNFQAQSDVNRFDGNWISTQQGSWAQGGSGSWSRGECNLGQDSWRDQARGSYLDKKPNPVAEVKCYRCLQSSHHQSECVCDPVCYKCKEKGHMAVDCKKCSKQLRMYGFGIPGQGFYAMNFPEEKVKASRATGVITIL